METSMTDRSDCHPEVFRDGLMQDLIAVRVIVDQARLALPADAGGLRDALVAAAGTLDADVEAVRAMDGAVRQCAAASAVATRGRTSQCLATAAAIALSRPRRENRRIGMTA